MQNSPPTPYKLPTIKQLLATGGDARIAIDPLSGLNKYGCSPVPDAQLLAFGSSTASNISPEAYAVANRLHEKLLQALSTEPPAVVYALEIKRLRQDYLDLCELSEFDGLELILSPSGTDLHALVAQYTGGGVSKPALIIMVEANETGSGVASALNENPVAGNNNVEVAQVCIRLDDGMPRLLAEIDAEVEYLVNKAVASDRRVLLILVDQSKTGLIAPSLSCVLSLHQRYPDNIDVLVDACQFRIAIPTLQAYLEQGFMLALTGSKFLTGPSFSAALLVPETVVNRFQKRGFPRGLLPGHNPDSWTADETLEQPANFGLLLRSAVALDELRRFRTVPRAFIINFIMAFAKTISQRMISDPHFEPLAVPQLDRRPLIEADSWDHLQTLFPFLLYELQSAERIPLSREQTRNVYQQLPIKLERPESDAGSIRCQLGQPVACGIRNDIPVSALRLCISSRLIVEAADRGDKGLAIINDALAALDKTAAIVDAQSGCRDRAAARPAADSR